MEKVFPEIVKTSELAGKEIDYNALTVILINSVKELDEKNKPYEKELQKLKHELKEIKKFVQNQK